MLLSFAEMVLNFNITLAQDTIVIYVCNKPILTSILIFYFRIWISSEDAAAVAEKNFRIVHVPSNYFYLARESVDTWQRVPICVVNRR